MAYPPALPPSNRQDSTLAAGNHAADHNALVVALADFVAELGANPAGAYSDVTSRLADVPANLAAQLAAHSSRLSRLEVLRNVKDFGAVGDGVADDTAAIQAAIDVDGIRGRAGTVYLPAGRYKITDTLYLPGAVQLIGSAPSPQGFAGAHGAELRYSGPSGKTALEWGTAAEGVSQGLIRNLRLSNAATGNAAGTGIYAIGPQNASKLERVLVKDFPTRQLLAKDPTAGGPLDGPGYFIVEDSFFIGGECPVEIASSVQSVRLTSVGIDTTAASTIAGLLLSVGTVGDGQAPRWPVHLDALKVELNEATVADIPAVKIDTRAPITFTAPELQRNLNQGAAPAIHYTGTGRKLPGISVRGAGVWRFGSLLKLEAAGVTVSPVGTTDVPWSASYNLDGADAALTFAKLDLGANVAGSSVGLCGLNLPGTNGAPMPRAGVVAGLSAEVVGGITAGNIQVMVLKNGATYLTEVNLTSAKTRDSRDSIALDEALPFVAGDRIGVYVTTNAALAPVNTLDLTANVFVKFLG